MPIASLLEIPAKVDATMLFISYVNKAENFKAGRPSDSQLQRNFKVPTRVNSACLAIIPFPLRSNEADSTGFCIRFNSCYTRR